MHRMILAAILVTLGTTVGIAQERPAWAKGKTGDLKEPKVSESDDPGLSRAGMRTVTATGGEALVVRTKVKTATMVILPEGEDVMDVVIGDPDGWLLSFRSNALTFRPKEAGNETNVSLTTITGGRFTLLLRAAKGSAQEDYQVTIGRGQATGLTNGLTGGSLAAPKYVPVEKVEALEAELASTRETVSRESQLSEERLEALREQHRQLLRAYPERWTCATDLPHIKPFLVQFICHDGEMTYFKFDGREQPVIHESINGKPAVVNFSVAPSGLYRVPKVLTRGYLTSPSTGKHLVFTVKD
jgi:type IV secretory pathway VirB9-like protein